MGAIKYQYHSDELQAVWTVHKKGESPQKIGVSKSGLDYFSFGMMLPNQTPIADEDGYRYGFNGMEKDDEVKSSPGTSYDFGARIYDPRVGRWLSRDPQEFKYPNQSPYVGMDNSPIAKNDPDGESAIVTIDKSSKTITVSSKMIFYGSAGSEAIAKQSATDIQTAWNDGAKDYFVEIGGEKYSVNFDISHEYKETIPTSEISENTNLLNNYIEIVDKGIAVSYMEGEGSNTGKFLVSNISKDGSTTEPHEYGHGLGLVPVSMGGDGRGHPGDGDLRGEGQPGIMNPRGTLVDAEFTYDPSSGDSKAPTRTSPASNTVNPEKRKVTHGDLDMVKKLVENKVNTGKYKVISDDKVQIELGKNTGK